MRARTSPGASSSPPPITAGGAGALGQALGQVHVVAAPARRAPPSTSPVPEAETRGARPPARASRRARCGRGRAPAGRCRASKRRALRGALTAPAPGEVEHLGRRGGQRQQREYRATVSGVRVGACVGEVVPHPQHARRRRAASRRSVQPLRSRSRAMDDRVRCRGRSRRSHRRHRPRPRGAAPRRGCPAHVVLARQRRSAAAARRGRCAAPRGTAAARTLPGRTGQPPRSAPQCSTTGSPAARRVEDEGDSAKPPIAVQMRARHPLVAPSVSPETNCAAARRRHEQRRQRDDHRAGGEQVVVGEELAAQVVQRARDGELVAAAASAPWPRRSRCRSR